MSRFKRPGAIPGYIILGILLLSSAFALAKSGRFDREHQSDNKAGVFDYYTFVMSWSPTYCATNGKRDRQQCGRGRRYAFVVHGLWPQFEKGWPQNCRVANSWVDRNIIDSMLNIMPSKRLIIHEWKKHGTCSGLAPKGYFHVTRKFYEAIKIPARYLAPSRVLQVSPEQLVADFVSTNRWLKADMMSVQCGNRRDRARLKEIRFCFTKKGAPRSCGRNERRACRAKVLTLPPVR